MANTKAFELNPGIIITFVLVLCTSALAFALSAASAIKPVLPFNAAEKHLKQQLDNHYQTFQYSALEHPQRVSDLYQHFEYRTIWFDHYELTKAGLALVQVIKENAVDQPENYPYHTDQILYQLQSMQTHPNEVTHLDILLTDAFLSYSLDALSGSLIPNQNEPDHPAFLKTSRLPPAGSQPSDDLTNSENALALLEGSLERHQLLPLIEETLTPRHQGYIKLRKALDHYLELAQADRWKPINAGKELKMGDTDAQVIELRQRLLLLGDMFNNKFSMIPAENFLKHAARDYNTPLSSPGNAIRSQQDYFDSDLAESLQHFQKRHGLHPNGILDDATREQLNIAPDKRISQIAINMKRWRYLPTELGEQYVMTNMADYSLKVVEQGETALEMDIIIGKESRRTPILVQTMKTLVLNPTWTIPPRIARTSILPAAKRNPKSLARQNIEIVRGTGTRRKVIDPATINWRTINIDKFPYRLEQKPGKKNALGEVKYPLNNGRAIYLHDTSKPHLFERSMRALSSGCVRVSDARKLTETLLKHNPGWDSKRIARAHNSKRTMYVSLKKEMPVYLMYWTAWVDETGTIQFRNDIYNRDATEDYDNTITMQALLTSSRFQGRL